MKKYVNPIIELNMLCKEDIMNGSAEDTSPVASAGALSTYDGLGLDYNDIK